MNTATYTIYKGPGDPCGTPTHFVLNIATEPNFKFLNVQVQETQGLYITKILVTLEENSFGPPVMFDLCDAPVVCSPDSVPLEILTEVQGDAKKTTSDLKDYNQAQVGGGQKAKSDSN